MNGGHEHRSRITATSGHRQQPLGAAPLAR